MKVFQEGREGRRRKQLFPDVADSLGLMIEFANWILYKDDFSGSVGMKAYLEWDWGENRR